MIVLVCLSYEPFAELLSPADFRMQLSSTDYGNFLANETTITTSKIAEKATQLLVDQFHFMRSNAVEPLSTFLDYMTFVYLPNVLNNYS